VREFRILAGVVALGLLPGIGSAYADLNAETPTLLFAFGTHVEGFFQNGASVTINVDDQYGNPVTLSNSPFTSLKSITSPEEISGTGYKFVINLSDAMGNPLIPYAAGLVLSASAFDLFVSAGNATTLSSLYGLGILEVAPPGVKNPPLQVQVTFGAGFVGSVTVAPIGDPEFYLTVGSPSLGGDIPALTPNPNLVPEPSSILLLAPAAFLVLARQEVKKALNRRRWWRASTSAPATDSTQSASWHRRSRSYRSSYSPPCA